MASDDVDSRRPLDPAAAQLTSPLLERHPDSDCEEPEGGGGGEGEGERLEMAYARQHLVNYPQRYRNAAAWILLLVAGYLATCGWTVLGLPGDGVVKHEAHTFMGDVAKLAMFGFTSAFYTGVASPERFEYVASRWYFYVAYFASSPVFAGFGEIHALQTSLSQGAQFSKLAIVIFPLSGLLVCYVLGWHMVHAFRAFPTRAGFVTYAAARLIPIAYFGLTVLVVKDLAAHKTEWQFHLHHYQICFAMSLFAEFNHPLSVLTLAITAGIFVQGVGAYEFADLMEPRRCYNLVHTPDLPPVQCTWTSDGAFEIRACVSSGKEVETMCSYLPAAGAGAGVGRVPPWQRDEPMVF